MSTKRVSEAAPVQVYLDLQSRDRLDRLAERLDTTKSDILRRGLIALERETSEPALHPVLKLAGTAVESGPPVGYDIAREHDRFLAEIAERQIDEYRRSRPPRG